MKISNNKKAQGVISNWPFWIMFGMAVAVIALVIVKIANVDVAEASNIPKDLEDELLLASRFYNSEECFAYEEEFKSHRRTYTRIYTRVIDTNKFKQEIMEKCFPRSNANYAFSLSLEESPRPEIGPVFTFGTLPVYTFNWEEGFAEKEITEDVFVLHNGIKYNGKLRIKIKNVK